MTGRPRHGSGVCRSAWLLVRGRRDGAVEGVLPVGYTRGTMGMPIAFVVVCVVETVAIHLLVPWPWLRTVRLPGPLGRRPTARVSRLSLQVDDPAAVVAAFARPARAE